MIYKPSNCHPFASAIDITKTFLELEQRSNSWVWKKPEAVYLTGKVETDNNLVIGYRVRLYMDGKKIFESDNVSPMSELPRFDEDKTINTGKNGTYFAIPFFQSTGTYNTVARNVVTQSYNAMYLTGSTQALSDVFSPSFNCDYVISSATIGEMTTSDFDNATSWVVNGASITPRPDLTWDGKLNGGYTVTIDDIICFYKAYGGYGQLFLCRLSSNPLGLTVLKTITSGTAYSAAIHIRKGKYCGVYGYDASAAGSVSFVENVDWANVFYALGFPWPNSKTALAGFDGAQLSWEVVLYQGPEDYKELLYNADYDYQPNYFVEDIESKYHNMKVTSGTVLGSCAQRLHLACANETMLPGENMQTVPVLQNTFCELFDSIDDTNRLTPSFLIGSFDASLGMAYPKDGYLSDVTLNDFRAGVSGEVMARFFKYSSNVEDALSNEKVDVCYDAITGNYDGFLNTLDPRDAIKPNSVIDGVTLSRGQRVLWNTNFENGKYNGIWVVEDAGEKPSRPADGDNWADYIGKITLVSGGNTFAGRVYESTAGAGSYELGLVGLFFREQTPIVLFSLPSSDYEEVEAVFPDTDVTNYMAFSWPAPTMVHLETRPLPVPTGTESVVIISGTREGKFMTDNRYVLRICLRDNRNPYAVLNLTGATPSSELPSGFSWLEIYEIKDLVESAAHWHLWVGARELSLDTPIQKAVSGAYAGCYFGVTKESSKVHYLTLDSSVYAAKVLFNSSTRTFISPSVSVESHQLLCLKNGATVKFGQHSPATSIIPIDRFVSKFNYINHGALYGSPLPPEKNESAVPSTPYSYDVVSCFRVSDQNGFTCVDPLVPYMESLNYAGYSIFTDAYCFQGDGKAWSSARLVLKIGDDPEKWQDTDWFHDGNLDTEFLGIDSGRVPHIIMYAKDSEGRITSSEQTVTVYSDGPYKDSAYSGVFPGTLTAEPDCTTQSVMITYTPAVSYSAWSEGLPVEQNGTYDVYRRDYADIKKTYACDGSLSSEGETAVLEGMWEPVAFGVDGPSVRDFNVKQGHSYQYAILPRIGASLKVERTYASGSPKVDLNTRIESEEAYIGFDRYLYDFSLSFSKDVSAYDGNGSPITITSATPSYAGTTVSGNLDNAYLAIKFSAPISLIYPIRFDIRLSQSQRHSCSARVIFTSYNEFTVEPLDDSYGWRTKLLANGGDPVYVQWDAWSLTELEEVDPSSCFENPAVRHPILRKAYKANLDRIWLFRYDAEPGSQSINLTKGEISTLGRYTRFSSGSLNAEGGEMSAWLGSEVVPGYRNGYMERRRSTIWDPVATNEAAAMLAAFRAMVASDKPKLLKDRKGRSWIVQVSGGSSTTMDNFVGTPTKISFSWKEIASTGPYVAIWGDGDELPPLDRDGEWKPNLVLTS